MPRDGSKTRTLLLDSAQDLVLQNGFAATSVDAILEASGSSKGAFFHHFENKRALAHALVARWVDADLEMLGQGLEAAADAGTAADRLVAFLSFYENWSGDLTAEEANCLYIATLTERDLVDEDTAKEMERAITGWRDAIAVLVREAYAEAGIADGPDPDDLADHLFVTFEGAFLMCRALATPDPMRQQLRVLRQLVEALLGA